MSFIPPPITDPALADFSARFSEWLTVTTERLMRAYYKTYEDWLIDGPDFAAAHEAAAKAVGLPSLITGKKAE
jgi:hypothetical protein